MNRIERTKSLSALQNQKTKVSWVRTLADGSGIVGLMEIIGVWNIIHTE